MVCSALIARKGNELGSEPERDREGPKTRTCNRLVRDAITEDRTRHSEREREGAGEREREGEK